METKFLNRTIVLGMIRALNDGQPMSGWVGKYIKSRDKLHLTFITSLVLVRLVPRVGGDDIIGGSPICESAAKKKGELIAPPFFK